MRHSLHASSEPHDIETWRMACLKGCGRIYKGKNGKRMCDNCSCDGHQEKQEKRLGRKQSKKISMRKTRAKRTLEEKTRDRRKDNDRKRRGRVPRGSSNRYIRATSVGISTSASIMQRTVYATQFFYPSFMFSSMRNLKRSSSTFQLHSYGSHPLVNIWGFFWRKVGSVLDTSAKIIYFMCLLFASCRVKKTLECGL